MIVSFKVQNFLSFRDLQEISFLPYMLPDKCHDFSENDVLKNIALYGPNGSGKTNLMFAIAYFLRILGCNKNILLNEYESKRLRSEVYCKTSADENVESLFEITFLEKDIYYSYGLVYDSSNGRITTEWIAKFHNGKQSTLYHRVKDEIKIGKRDHFKNCEIQTYETVNNLYDYLNPKISDLAKKK